MKTQHHHNSSWRLVLLISTLVSIGLQIYLTNLHYRLHFSPQVNDSVCNINSTFNCHAVSLSQYSQLFGIPLALWGLATLFVLFAFWVMDWLGESSSRMQIRRYMAWIGIIVFAASIVMGFISAAFLQTYCLFCIFLYVLSIPILVSTQKLATPWLPNLKQDFISLFTSAKYALVFFLLIPGVAYLGNSGMEKQMLGDMSKKRFAGIMQESIQKWKTSQKFEFAQDVGITKGATAENAKVEVVEFADFSCGHCKNAIGPLTSFINSHVDITLRLIIYPLDSACNNSFENPPPEMHREYPCHLAKALICASQQEQAWPMHDRIFASQENIRSLPDAEREVSQHVADLQLNTDSFEQCMKAESTLAEIHKQVAQGTMANIRGTPSIFINGRQMQGGVFLPGLEAIYKEALK